MDSASPLGDHSLSERYQSLSKVEIKLVADAIKEAKQIINESTKGDHIVLFWGFSGTGKSSAIITLNGQKLLGYHKGDPIVIEANPTKEKNGVKIQIQATAGTIYPAVLELKYRNGKQKVMLWDMPGIGQNRGATQSLINSYFIHRIFEFQPIVKLIFTIEFFQVVPNKRGNHLQETLTNLTKILGNVKNYDKSIAIMITKVPPINNQQMVIGFLKQILLHLPSINEKDNFKFLLTKLIKKQIPLILSKQPKILSQEIIPKSKAVDVTNQYTNFIKEVYTIVTTRLKPSSFPKLVSPAMSNNQIVKCKTIVDQTHRNIDIIIERIKIQLPLFVRGNIQPIKVSFNQDQFRNGLQRYANIQGFVRQIVKKGNDVLKLSNKQQIKTKFDELKKLFQTNNFLSNMNKKTKVMECISMSDLNDNYIMIRFLNFLSFKKTQVEIRWEDQSDIIKQLFRTILDCQLENILQEFVDKLNDETKKAVLQRIAQFVISIQKEEIYKNWANQFRIIPAFILISSRFDKNVNHLQYFGELIKTAKKIQLSNVASIQGIFDMLTLKEAVIPLPQANQFLNNQIKPIYSEQGKKLINKAIKYQNWSEMDVNNAIGYYQQMNFGLQKQNLSKKQKVMLNNLNSQKQKAEQYKMSIIDKDRQIEQLKSQNKKLLQANSKAEEDKKRKWCCDIY